MHRYTIAQIAQSAVWLGETRNIPGTQKWNHSYIYLEQRHFLPMENSIVWICLLSHLGQVRFAQNGNKIHTYNLDLYTFLGNYFTIFDLENASIKNFKREFCQKNIKGHIILMNTDKGWILQVASGSGNGYSNFQQTTSESKNKFIEPRWTSIN